MTGITDLLKNRDKKAADYIRAIAKTDMANLPKGAAKFEAEKQIVKLQNIAAFIEGGLHLGAGQ